MSLLVVGPGGLTSELASVREALLTNAEETWRRLTEAPYSEEQLRQLAYAAHTSQATRLDLAANDIGVEAVRLIGQMPRLQQLNVQRNRFGDAGVQALFPMPALETLDLSECGLSEDATVWLTRLERLRSLDLSINNIGDTGCAVLARHWRFVVHLREMKVSGCGIGDNGLLFLAELPALETLDVSFNNITSIATLASNLSLRNLDLQYNQVGDFNPLADNLMLQRLNIEGNPGPVEPLRRSLNHAVRAAAV